MSSKFKKSFILYYLGIIVTILLCIFSIIYIFIKEEKFSLDSETETIYKNNYKMNISYPVFNNSKTNKEINKIVNEEKKLFLDTIDTDANYENELNVNYIYTTKDDIYSVHLRSYSYTGEDADYYRNDNIFYFDSIENKEITINDLITSEKFYELLSQECYKYLTEQQKFDIYDNDVLNKVLKDKETYQLVIFSEDMIYVIFTPHVVSPYDAEVNVPVSYDSVNEYLNTEYIKNDEEIVIEETEEVETISRIRDFSEFEGKKVVALTFDDGPAYSKTETLLTEFEKRNVRATFFVLGELAIKQPDLVKKTYDMGHTIGSHTYDHKNLKKITDEEINYEVDYTNEILSGIIGTDIKYLRPPYGGYNKEILEKVDMTFILWNKDTMDWDLRDADKLAQYLVENIEDGDIVLMHDIHQETIDGVIKALDILEGQGYVFVSLEELMAYRGIEATPNTSYRSFKVISDYVEEPIIEDNIE